MENKEILLALGEDGIVRKYDNTYDVTIHCESKEDQEKLMSSLVIPRVGKTNGDMIKALYPNCKTWEVDTDMAVDLPDMLRINLIPLDWWNAPYKRAEHENT